MSGPKRSRLGRGLGALLGDDYLANPATEQEVRTLTLGSISANPFQPRQDFPDDELEELAQSIRENGLLQPLVVRPDPEESGRYQLVAGERRFRALHSLGSVEAPAVVREMDDRTLLVLAMVENIQREALSPLDEAEGFRVLTEEFDLTQEEVAEAVGKKRATVANTLRLLRLPLSLRRLLQKGELSMGHARALLSVEETGRMIELGRRAAKEGWSVREVERRTRTTTDEGGGKATRSRGSKASDAVDPVVRELEKALQEALGARVSLRTRSGGQGVVEVPFRSAEDFERVFELLTGRSASEVTG